MSKETITASLSSARRYIGFFVIVAAAGAFVWYLRAHPGALDPLRATPLYLIPLLVVLYGLFLLTNFFITAITITISGKSYPLKDSLMLTVYSTLVNFFGPLQSGPGFRAVYLKKKIGLGIKDYTLATMLYYGAFLAISLVMMLGIRYPLATLAIVVVITGAGVWFFRTQKLATLIRNFAIVGLVTLVQLALIAIIYYLELRATGYHPSLAATLTYTGSANLALFVAFTPGAIGIRESFIYFSQSIHHIPTDHILSAGLLDRSIYLIFLGILFISSSSLHISSKLRAR
ncbi:MAG TPA: lysylphosphatidylglycerol synthase domain-containing protein [Candidatus Limnocylindria bacterium]|nr:lysylphosphatidylglycerol synthase domain-containing protein [Candidatus Limnocylindria bacterium]